jgi:hypothetical protein
MRDPDVIASELRADRSRSANSRRAGGAATPRIELANQVLDEWITARSETTP